MEHGVTSFSFYGFIHFIFAHMSTWEQACLPWQMSGVQSRRVCYGRCVEVRAGECVVADVWRSEQECVSWQM